MRGKREAAARVKGKSAESALHFDVRPDAALKCADESRTTLAARRARMPASSEARRRRRDLLILAARLRLSAESDVGSGK